MELYPIDEKNHIFISPDIDTWEPIIARSIKAVFDLDGGLDTDAPSMPNDLLYIHFPFDDRDLPDEFTLHQLAKLGANLVRSECRILSHCAMGHNRSALLAGIILTYLGISGKEAVEIIRQRRQGALYNRTYAAYLQSLPAFRPAN